MSHYVGAVINNDNDVVTVLKEKTAALLAQIELLQLQHRACMVALKALNRQPQGEPAAAPVPVPAAKPVHAVVGEALPPLNIPSTGPSANKVNGVYFKYLPQARHYELAAACLEALHTCRERRLTYRQICDRVRWPARGGARAWDFQQALQIVKAHGYATHKGRRAFYVLADAGADGSKPAFKPKPAPKQSNKLKPLDKHFVLGDAALVLLAESKEPLSPAHLRNALGCTQWAWDVTSRLLRAVNAVRVGYNKHQLVYALAPSARDKLLARKASVLS